MAVSILGTTCCLAADAGDRRLRSALAGQLGGAVNAIGLRGSTGMETAYDVGRDLEDAVRSASPISEGCAPAARAALALGRGLVREAEGFDRIRPHDERAARVQARSAARRVRADCRSHGRLVSLLAAAPALPLVPASAKAVPERATDRALAQRIASAARAFRGWAAIWTHDLATGRTAGWNSDARFPAASTGKLGVLLATLGRLRHPERSRYEYDLRAMVEWSSNLATNRLLARIAGPAAAEAALWRVGARRSTFPQGYRIGTAARTLDVRKTPPHVSGRETTAHDLGRVLYAIHACALGNRSAQRAARLDAHRCNYALRLLLASDLRDRNNVGLFHPWLQSGLPVAQKNGWLHDARHSAAIVYGVRGPMIAVVLTYAPNLDPAVAKRLGGRVVRLLGLG